MITRSHWQRRDDIRHHRVVQIDLDALPDDPAILQQMLREVVRMASCKPRTTSCGCWSSACCGSSSAAGRSS